MWYEVWVSRVTGETQYVYDPGKGPYIMKKGGNGPSGERNFCFTTIVEVEVQRVRLDLRQRSYKGVEEQVYTDSMGNLIKY